MDRQKYLDQREVKLLRAVTENQSIEDMKVGLIGGVLRWMVVDTAMSTGLRVAELAALRCGDVNLSRSCLTITRGKRKIRKPETLAIGKDFAEHLREFMEWKSRVGQPIGKTDVLFMGKRGTLVIFCFVTLQLPYFPACLSINSCNCTYRIDFGPHERAIGFLAKGAVGSKCNGVSPAFRGNGTELAALAGFLAWSKCAAIIRIPRDHIYHAIGVDEFLRPLGAFQTSQDLSRRRIEHGDRFIQTGRAIDLVSDGRQLPL